MYEIWLILHALIHGFHTPCSQLLGVRNEFYSVSTPPPPNTLAPCRIHWCFLLNSPPVPLKTASQGPQ